MVRASRDRLAFLPLFGLRIIKTSCQSVCNLACDSISMNFTVGMAVSSGTKQHRAGTFYVYSLIPRGLIVKTLRSSDDTTVVTAMRGAMLLGRVQSVAA
jgi:hypothetical protein